MNCSLLDKSKGNSRVVNIRTAVIVHKSIIVSFIHWQTCHLSSIVHSTGNRTVKLSKIYVGGGELILFWGKSNIKFSLHQNLTPRVITSKHIMVVWGLFCFAKIVIKKKWNQICLHFYLLFVWQLVNFLQLFAATLSIIFGTSWFRSLWSPLF